MLEGIAGRPSNGEGMDSGGIHARKFGNQHWGIAGIVLTCRCVDACGYVIKLNIHDGTGRIADSIET